MAGASDLAAASHDGGTSTTTRVLVLGQLTAESSRGRLYVTGAHRRRLLALLASRTGNLVTVDTIIDALWGDEPPPSAATTVRSHVSRLRQALRDETATVLEAVPGGYRLTLPKEHVDAGQFERLVVDGHRLIASGDHPAAVETLMAALELWRGPAYAEFRDTSFGSAEGVRLDELHFSACEDLAEAQLATGAGMHAVIELERLVHTSPGRERAWQLLMRGLAATGRQHDALNAFQRARRALADLGVEPSADLRETERRVLEQRQGASAPSGQSVLAAALRTSTSLVGRRDERRLLALAWVAARGGQGQVRIVSGALESGRTRLAADVAGRAIADGGSVEYARGDELLMRLTSDAASGGSIGRAVDALAERCRTRPMLLVVDDVEWASGQTVELLSALAAAAEQLALLLLLVVDPSGGGPAVAALRRLDGTHAATIELAAMAPDEIAEIVARDGVDASAVAAIVAVAHGLPGVARREAAAWSERTAGDRLRAAAVSSLGATAAAENAQATVLDEVLELVRARSRRDELWSARWAGRQPYRALASYGAQDAELFVGRERLVAELAALVLERRLVVVTGASGSGKSSLARAGLVPLARSGRLPGTGAWSTHVMVPGFDPVASLASIDELAEPGSRLLVVDQFEEAFASPAPIVEQFASHLAELAIDPDLDTHVVLVVRADAFLKTAALGPFADLIGAPLLVGPPSTDEMRRIITEPARRTGATVEAELVELIAHDVGDHEAALPLVSAALAELWERRQGGVLRCAEYIELGGLATAVERLGDRLLETAGAEHIDAVRFTLLQLADVTDEGVWTRRRAAVAELPDDPVALGALIDSRLVVRTDDHVEIAHEVVFRAWPQLATWLDEARHDLVLERELRAAARTWESDGRTEDDLLRGGRLHAALEWAARGHGSLSPSVEAFLNAGRDLSERREREMREQLTRERHVRRRVSRLLTAAAVLLVLAVVAGGVAISSRNDARASAADAGQQALVSASVALRGTDRQLAALLAVEAHRLDPSAATEDALFGLFTTFPGLGRTVTLEDGALGDTAILLPPTGTTIATTDKDGVIRLIDAETGREIDHLGDPLRGSDEEELATQILAAAPDGRHLASVVSHFETSAAYRRNEVSTLSVWDMAARTRVFGPVPIEIVAGAIVIDDAAERVVVAGGRDGRIGVFDARTGELERELPSLPRPDDAVYGTNTVALDFAPDGTLAVGSQAGPVRFFDLATGIERSRFDAGDQMSEGMLEVSADGGSIATEGFSGLMRFSLPDGAPLWNSRPDVICQAGSLVVPSVNAILCGESGGRLVEIDLDTGAVRRSPLESQSGNTFPLATPDGRTMLALTASRYSIWRLDGNGPVQRLVPLDQRPLGVAYTHDGGRLMTVSGDLQLNYVVEVRDATTGSLADRFTGVGKVWFDSATDAIVTTDLDGGVTRYDVDAASAGGTHTISLEVPPDGVSILGPSRAIAFTNDALPMLLDFESGNGTPLTDEEPIILARPLGTDRVVTVTKDEHVQVRDRELRVLEQSAEPQGLDSFGGLRETFDLATAPNLIARSSFEAGVDLLDTATLRVVGSLPAADRTLSPLVFDRAARRVLAAGFDHTVHLFDAAARIQIGGGIPTSGVYPSYFRPSHAPSQVSAEGALRDDGLQAAIVTNDGVELWDLDPSRWVSAACEIASRNLTREEWDEYIGDLADYHPTCPEFAQA